jgi:amino acid adenylation domain-containing protein
LAVGPPWRATLIRLGPDDHVLLLSAHHLALDQWSWPVLLADLGELYRAGVRGQPGDLGESPVQPADYAIWQQLRLAEPEVRSLLEDWREEMRGVPVRLGLPTDYARDHLGQRTGGTAYRVLPSRLVERLEVIGRSEGATLFVTTLAAYGLLLSRHARQRRLIVTIPMAADRFRPELDRTVGMLVDAVPLVLDTDATCFRELLQNTRQAMAGVFARQDLPYQALMGALAADQGFVPHQQAAFNIAYEDDHAAAFTGLDVRSFPVGLWSPSPLSDLTLSLDMRWNPAKTQWLYDTGLFQPQVVAMMADEYVAMLNDAVQAPAAPLSRLRGIPPEGLSRLVMTGTSTPPAPPPEETITERFTRYVRECPDAIAVWDGAESLTYEDLATRSDQLAAVLARRGVPPDTPVGVCMGRSAAFVVAMLAVLKAGAAYLPLDPEFPEARLQAIATEAGGRLVITDSVQRDRMPGTVTVLVIGQSGRPVTTEPDSLAGTAPAATVIRPDQLAYVMTTSGSTGRPKCVAITHRGVLGLVADANYLHVTPGDRIAQTASACSDNLTFEVWAPLLNGACVDILEHEVVLSPGGLASAITGRGITVLSVTSAIINNDEHAARLAGTPLRALLFGGEAASPAAIRQLVRGGFRGAVVHTYGPTETTMLGSYQPVSAVTDGCLRIPVGYPVSATELYVMDEWLRPVPAGRPGEICIAGERLARGYLGQAGLTAERFCPDPLPHRAGQRMYRTGDLGRRLQGGQLEILGRLDRQVKIHGFRVEPAEIEAVLAGLPDVSQAAVTCRRDRDHAAELAAYVAAEPGRDLSPTALRRELSALLPGQIVPSTVTVLPRLPLTPGGKVDHAALPAPAREMRSPDTLTRDHDADPRMRRVAAILADLLGLDTVGPHDDFFALGGHSLLAIRLISRIQQEIGIDIPVGYLLAHPTVAEIARWHDDKAPPAATPGNRNRAPTRNDGDEVTRVGPSVIAMSYGSGAMSTLVLVHPGGGGILCYGPVVAQLGDSYPAVGLEAGQPGGVSVSELAAAYVDELRSVVYGRPLVLAGWSLGGVIAHEMARIWQAGSDAASPVVMIDSWPYRQERQGRWHPLESFIYDLARTAGMDMPALPAGFADRDAGDTIEALLAALPPEHPLCDIGTDPLIRRYRQFADLAAAHRRHTPAPYSGRVTLIRASRSDSAASTWEPLSGSFTEKVMAGDHYTILQESAGQVAACLIAELAAAEGVRSDLTSLLGRLD